MKPTDEKIKWVLKESFKEANRLGADSITPDHMILSILNDKKNKVIDAFNSMDYDCEDLGSKVEAFLRLKIKTPQIKKKLVSLSECSKRALNISEMESDKFGDDFINEEHLMLAILKDKELDCTKVLNHQGIYYKKFKEKLLETKTEINMSIADDFDEMGGLKGKKSSNKSNTPVLDNFGRDITDIAAKGGIDPIIGRDEEVERVSQVLSRRKKNNPILIGEPGVGKTAIVEGLALKIVQKKCPSSFW